MKRTTSVSPGSILQALKNPEAMRVVALSIFFCASDPLPLFWALDARFKEHIEGHQTFMSNDQAA